MLCVTFHFSDLGVDEAEMRGLPCTGAFVTARD